MATGWIPSPRSAREVVFNKNLLKDIQQLSLCCHTGNLEVYDSIQTRYVPKRQHFSHKGMVVRTQLTALYHNVNTGRQQAIVTRDANQGEGLYKLVFPKHTKAWVAKPVQKETSKDHLKPLLDAIIDRKNKSPGRGVQHSQFLHTFPEILLANQGLLEKKLLPDRHQDFQVNREWHYLYLRIIPHSLNSIQLNSQLLKLFYFLVVVQNL